MENDADFFLSLHCNFSEEGNPTGFSAYYGHEPDPMAKSFVKKLTEEGKLGTDYYFMHRKYLLAAIQSIKQQKAGFFLLKEAACPTVMLHLGTVNNEKEQALITDPKSRKAIAGIIIKSLEDLSEEKQK